MGSLINSFNNYIYNNKQIFINWKVLIMNIITFQTDGTFMKENSNTTRTHRTEILSYKKNETHTSITVFLNAISTCI